MPMRSWPFSRAKLPEFRQLFLVLLAAASLQAAEPPADAASVADTAHALETLDTPDKLEAAEPTASPEAGTVVRAPHWEFAHSTHFRARPVDGTVLCPVGDTQCYVVAGGAPVAIKAAAVPAVPVKAGIRVARTELRTPLRLNHKPVDGTVLKSAQTGATYTVQAGVAKLVTAKLTGAAATKAPIVIDQNAVDNAGMPGAWSHLASAPAVAEASMIQPPNPCSMAPKAATAAPAVA